MKKHLFLILLSFTSLTSYTQDLISLQVGTNLPDYTYNSTNRSLTVQLTIRNTGFFNADPFDCALFAVSNSSSSVEYEIGRNNYSGLPYPTGNTLQITSWLVDLDNFSIPAGTYRLEARINDNQNAFESNYNNNDEYFGQKTFVYAPGSTADVGDLELKQMKIFPNPAENFVKISSSDKIINLIVSDFYGKQVLNKISNFDQKLDVLNFEPGVYVLEAFFEDGTYYVQRFVKK